MDKSPSNVLVEFFFFFFMFKVNVPRTKEFLFKLLKFPDYTQGLVLRLASLIMSNVKLNKYETCTSNMYINR